MFVLLKNIQKKLNILCFKVNKNIKKVKNNAYINDVTRFSKLNKFNNGVKVSDRFVTVSILLRGPHL